MSDSLAEKAMRVANSTAAKVLTEAMLHKCALPTWKDGKIEYVIPSQK